MVLPRQLGGRVGIASIIFETPGESVTTPGGFSLSAPAEIGSVVRRVRPEWLRPAFGQAWPAVERRTAAAEWALSGAEWTSYAPADGRGPSFVDGPRCVNVARLATVGSEVAADERQIGRWRGSPVIRLAAAPAGLPDASPSRARAPGIPALRNRIPAPLSDRAVAFGRPSRAPPRRGRPTCRNATPHSASV